MCVSVSNYTPLVNEYGSAYGWLIFGFVFEGVVVIGALIIAWAFTDGWAIRFKGNNKRKVISEEEAEKFT